MTAPVRIMDVLFTGYGGWRMLELECDRGGLMIGPVGEGDGPVKVYQKVCKPVISRLENDADRLLVLDCACEALGVGLGGVYGIVQNNNHCSKTKHFFSEVVI